MAAAQHPPAAHNVLEVDESASGDADSVYNESIGTASYVSSLSSSIKNYTYENGRRYHAYHEGAYVVPNDEDEQDRMDLAHHIYLLLLDGRLHLAPIDNNLQRVLDIGTGTGIWAIDFADEHPSAQVIGTDLSPIQPPWMPPNCIFEIDDFETQWVYKKEFDFIHGRELEGCITDDDRLFRTAFNHLKSGGYLEFQGTYPYWLSEDDTAATAKNCQLWIQKLHEAGEKFGKSFVNAPLWKEKMQNAGFVDVQEVIHQVPIGQWPKNKKLKEAGKCQLVQQILAVESYTPALFSRVLGWNNAETEVLLAGVRNELKDRSRHMYLPVYLVHGRKP